MEPRSDVYRAALIRAAELVGGPEALAHRLQVPIAELARWLAGEGRPNISVFFRVVDVLVEESQSQE